MNNTEIKNTEALGFRIFYSNCLGSDLSKEGKNAENDIDDTVDLHEKTDNSAEDVDYGKGSDKSDDPTDDCAENDSDNEPYDEGNDIPLLCLEAERPILFKKFHIKYLSILFSNYIINSILIKCNSIVKKYLKSRKSVDI